MSVEHNIFDPQLPHEAYKLLFELNIAHYLITIIARAFLQQLQIDEC